MDFDLIMLEMQEMIDEKMNHFEKQLSKISTGAANPAMLRGVKVLYYEELTPLETVATISVPEAMQLLIKPFDYESVKDIMKALMNSGLDINPVNEGDKIRITFQPLTTDRKRMMVKNVAKLSEEAKIGIRLARQNANHAVTKAEDLSKDLAENYKEEIQKQTDKWIQKIVDITKEKEIQIMKV
ncbi:ribosome recycling factor [Mycoplasma testudineum]|uniref:Ribosome recycling factor n=1 Tax=Mycoplasma testudineum TaxID=244584 RepID=A0A4R6IC33_9MOLU|nr:ribosome-recycling factor [Mycoplasma testudineum]OYD26544.1 ribosome recycling factor [Mycoplasma testudineum]TDO19117.1 ribosome recycling factor [Mycoplasma testudineum]